ncbi:MAG: transposase [bacterium]
MRSRYKNYPDSGVYFITSTVIDWVPIIINEPIALIILESFKFCQKEKNLLIYGYVIMLNHFHMMIGMEEPDKIPDVIRDLKRHTSQEIK